MATTVPEPPTIDERRDPSRPTLGSGNECPRTPLPTDGNLPAVKEYSPPPASTGIWVALASIAMTFAAFTSALIVRQGSALDWQHLTLPRILYLNTAILFASSFALEVARRRISATKIGSLKDGIKNQDANQARWLYIALFLGMLF